LVKLRLMWQELNNERVAKKGYPIFYFFEKIFGYLIKASSFNG